MKITEINNGKVEVEITKTEQDRLIKDETFREFILNRIACKLADVEVMIYQPVDEEDQVWIFGKSTGVKY